MATVTVCNRCGRRLDGNLERQTRRHVVILSIHGLTEHPQEYELDLCEDHAKEAVEEFTTAPFMDSISV